MNVRVYKLLLDSIDLDQLLRLSEYCLVVDAVAT